MKLDKLIYSDMYRDGGSLESVWTTSENSEWVICLKVENAKSAFIPFEDRKFSLHNTKRNNCSNDNKIIKDTKEFQTIMYLISEWYLQADKLKIPSRLHDFMLSLHKGNF